MRKTRFAVLLVRVLILAVASIGYAQSAGGQNDYEGWLRNLDGAIFVHYTSDGSNPCYQVRGRFILAGQLRSDMCQMPNPNGRLYPLNENQFDIECFDRDMVNTAHCIGTISPDGRRITMSGGAIEGWNYPRLR
ncbi:MAG: hypothetical protein ABSC04_09805 [Syntrophobacteraceae bacterium]|jgi:hypothetical protein